MSSKKTTATRWLNRKLAGAKKQYAYAAGFTLVSVISFVLFSFFLADFAATWLYQNIVTSRLLLLSLLFLIGRYVFAHFASLQNYKAGNIIVTRIKQQLYPALLHNNSFDSTSSTLYVTKISDDLKPYFTFFIPYAGASVVVSLSLLTVCFWVEKWVGLVLLISLLVIPMQMVVIGIGAEAMHKKHINLFVRYSAVFYNRLKTIAEIVNLNNFETQYRFLKDKGLALNRATANVMRIAVLSSAVLELFVTLSIAAIAIYLGMSLLGIMPGVNYNNGYNFRIALFLLTLAPYFFFYLRKFVSAYHDKNRALAAAELLIPILNDKSPEVFTDIDQSIRRFQINELHFTYPDSSVKALNNICIELPIKGLVLVKGISGSGKSTLLKICAGCLPVQQGYVSINERDNEWSRQWLLANSSYMNQFPFIFDGTLQYNVFLESTFDEKINYPAFLNKIIIKKNDGWKSELSNDGKQLSGGERQLITLARLMLHPRPIALIDEPTANLDAETTAIILSEIATMSKERLVIVASHEPMFEAVADQTVHLNWGEHE